MESFNLIVIQLTDFQHFELNHETSNYITSYYFLRYTTVGIPSVEDVVFPTLYTFIDY